VHAIFRHDYPLAVEPASTPRPLVQKNLIDSLSIDIFLSAVSILVVAHSSSEFPEGLMNNPVFCSFGGQFPVFRTLCFNLSLCVFNIGHLLSRWSMVWSPSPHGQFAFSSILKRWR